MGSPVAVAVFVALIMSGVVAFNVGDDDVSDEFDFTLRQYDWDKSQWVDSSKSTRCRWGPCNKDDQCPKELPSNFKNYGTDRYGARVDYRIVDNAFKYHESSGCWSTRVLCCRDHSLEAAIQEWEAQRDSH